ncbi:hypothetical protein FHT85_001829 [Rhizobium sp. BK312]|nr:hypothetical protein [Rhizobium sp. BK312]MBB3424855.1 hypothetical protein [Rhizobium sp. BK312]
MSMNVLDGKAERHCGRGEIHGCTHPVGINDAHKLGERHLQFKSCE